MNPTEPNQPVPAVPGTEPSAQPVMAADRAAIYEKSQKYQETYFGTTPEPSATTITPEPAPVEPPVTAPQAVPDQTSLALQALLAEVTSLKAQIAKPTEAPAATTPEDWLQLLSEGKKSDGEKALAKALGPQIQQQAVQQALAIMQAERAVNDFVSEIRTANPDLVPMEDYIALAADAKIQAARNAGSINSPADYVKVYKEAVSAEIEKARTLTRTFQGFGKTQATTRIEQVAAVPTLKPNTVNVQREAPVSGEPAPAETASDYLAKRQAQHARISGMGS